MGSIFDRKILTREGFLKKYSTKNLFAALIVIGLVSFSNLNNVFAAPTAKRYLIMYKSEQGFKNMNQFMSADMTNRFGFSKALNNIQNTVIRTADLSLIASLKNHPEVADVVEEYFLPVPKLMNGVKLSIPTEEPVAHVMNENANPDSFVQTDGTPWGIVAVRAPGAWGLSDAGSKSRVLIIDTGVDVNHVALKNNIEKVKNFVPASQGGKIDPLDVKDEVGHGTHCSGTVAGQYNDKTGFVGVAPRTKVLMGKVCNTQGCSSIDVAAGIDWGVQEKVDVISMSLGTPGPTGNPMQDAMIEYMNKPIKAALKKAEAAGVFTVAASGNSASDATDTKPEVSPRIGYPASIPTVYAVGALNDDLSKASFSQWGPELDITAPGAAVLSTVPMQSGRNSQVYLTINGQKTLIKSASFSGTKEITVPKSNNLVAAGLGKVGEFPATVAGKFALISRGEITFAEKIKNAQAAKAVGVVFYNNAKGLVQGTAGEGQEIDYPVVMIEKEKGEEIVALLKQGQSASTEVSTVKSDYASFDGTSMATPHVAGVAALVISTYKLKHNGVAPSPAIVRAVLNKSAQKTTFPNADNRYGAGLVRADSAVVLTSKIK